MSGFLFFCTCTCFMGFDTGAVNTDILHIRIRCQIREDLLEDSGLGPFLKPFLHGLPWTISFWKISPRSSASKNPADSIKHRPGIFGWPSSWAGFLFFRNVGLYLLPFLIGYLIPSKNCCHRLHLWLYNSTFEAHFPFGYSCFCMIMI